MPSRGAAAPVSPGLPRKFQNNPAPPRNQTPPGRREAKQRRRRPTARCPERAAITSRVPRPLPEPLQLNAALESTAPQPGSPAMATDDLYPVAVLM